MDSSTATGVGSDGTMVRAGGRREQNKLDKLRRIQRAARSVFLSKGYDDATTREIAIKAKVALGTLFTYAENKRDLLFLVINDEYGQIAQKAALIVSKDAALLDNLLAVFSLLYKFFAVNPRLSRYALREMMFYESGPQAARFVATRSRMVRTSCEIIRNAQQTKAIGSAEDCDFIGQVIFAVYQIELRRWLSSEPLDVAKGIAALRRALLVVIHGLSPRLKSRGAWSRPSP
jgi:AcrR family transcriptional regulator